MKKFIAGLILFALLICVIPPVGAEGELFFVGILLGFNYNCLCIVCKI